MFEEQGPEEVQLSSNLQYKTKAKVRGTLWSIHMFFFCFHLLLNILPPIFEILWPCVGVSHLRLETTVKRQSLQFFSPSHCLTSTSTNIVYLIIFISDNCDRKPCHCFSCLYFLQPFTAVSSFSPLFFSMDFYTSIIPWQIQPTTIKLARVPFGYENGCRHRGPVEYPGS